MKEIKVLIVEDSMATAKAIKKSLLNLNYEVVGIAASGEEAIRDALLHRPSLILMDIILKGEMNGIEAATKINNVLNIPIIYLTAMTDKRMLEEAKLSEGYSFLIKPFQENELYFNIEMTLYKHEMKNKIEEERKWLNTILQNIGDGVIAIDKEENIKFINQTALNLLGSEENKIIGNNIYQQVNLFELDTGEKVDIMSINEKSEKILESSDGNENIVICQITAIPKNNKEKMGYVITIRDITEEKKLKKDINYLTFYDQLTGINNRTYFEEEFPKFNDPKYLPISVIMTDLNGLKLTNDIFGHQAGDELIKKTADVLNKSTRSTDLVARIGGDEFIIVLPNTSKNIAEKVVDRILKQCSMQETVLGKVSMAIGTATKEDADTNIYSTMSEADHKMYSNKFIKRQTVLDEILEHLKRKLRDNFYTKYEHHLEFKRIIIEMGKKINFTAEQLNELSLYAEIRDIGMISIPQEIQNKNCCLSDKEWDIVRKHVEAGYNIASSFKKYASIADYILYHHERWDGKGYPHKLKGQQIPLISRIISIVEAYDSMISKKEYRRTLSKEDAIDEILRCGGTQFDPELVRVFESVV